MIGVKKFKKSVILQIVKLSLLKKFILTMRLKIIDGRPA